MDINVLHQLLDGMYTLAVEGTEVTDSAAALAKNYLASAETRYEAAEYLVAWGSLKACDSGFACGVAGDVLLPLTVAADICSSLFIQIRLCLAVAIIGGPTADDPRIRLLCWSAVASDTCIDALSGIMTRLLSRALTLPEAEKALLTAVRSEFMVKDGGRCLKEGLLISLLGGVVNGTAA